jgi:ATP-binding cassette subfamily G (WHITE) protein 2 (SNQ2)
LQIRCTPGEFAIFNPPSDHSCATWANDFVDAFGGYLDNPGDAQACRYCQYKASLTLNLWRLKTIQLIYDTE